MIHHMWGHCKAQRRNAPPPRGWPPQKDQRVRGTTGGAARKRCVQAIDNNNNTNNTNNINNKISDTNNIANTNNFHNTNKIINIY